MTPPEKRKTNVKKAQMTAGNEPMPRCQQATVLTMTPNPVQNLEKHTLYNLSIEHPVDYLNESLSKIPVRFYTLGKLNSKFAIIYGNCIINEKNYEDKFSLLKHLSENINNYDYVFHC